MGEQLWGAVLYDSELKVKPNGSSLSESCISVLLTPMPRPIFRLILIVIAKSLGISRRFRDLHCWKNMRASDMNGTHILSRVNPYFSNAMSSGPRPSARIRES